MRRVGRRHYTQMCFILSIDCWPILEMQTVLHLIYVCLLPDQSQLEINHIKKNGTKSAICFICNGDRPWPSG